MNDYRVYLIDILNDFLCDKCYAYFIL